MLIGILSDSHGQRLRLRRAIELFDRLGAGHIIHCGDVGHLDLLDELVSRPVHFVWGNCDTPERGVHAYLAAIGLPAPPPPPLSLTLAGKRILVFHGHEREMHHALDHPSADYLLHGHTHACRDELIGSMRVINPGALHRATPKTVATLDLTVDRLEFHVIEP